jgi:hypothetical protein
MANQKSAALANQKSALLASAWAFFGEGLKTEALRGSFRRPS